MREITCKFGQTVAISENVTVTVVDIRGSQVRLGFRAPHSVTIHRHEVHERITRERRKA